MKEKRSIIMFYDLLHLINSLNVSDAGILVQSLIDYELKGTLYDWTDSKLEYIYNIGINQLDRGKQLFEQKYGSNNE
jgi:hypothetical protein